jgi:hypothetical protein
MRAESRRGGVGGKRKFSLGMKKAGFLVGEPAWLMS